MAHDLPIVFMHYGRGPYLPFTGGRAQMLNLDSPIILIGDDLSRGCLPFAHYVPLNDYAHRAVDLEKVYRHVSSNSENSERFCFQRWFILRDFMRRHSLSQVIHLDSDVLINVNVQAERERWGDYGLTLVRRVCAGNMFVNGIEMLDALCEIIWSLYNGPGHEDRFAAALARRGGMSDMTALDMLFDEHPTRIAEMTGVQPDGSYWDANINEDEGFEHNGQIKAVRWVDGRPYCREVATGRDVFFKSLHYQGMAKKQVESAFRRAYPNLAGIAAGEQVARAA